MARLTEVPTEFASGTSVEMTLTFPDYPASDGWGLKFYIAAKDLTPAMTGSANGSGFDVTISVADSTRLAAGTYRWAAIATKAADVKTAASGYVKVTPNLAAALPGELQSWEEKTLEIVEARLSGRLDDQIAQYSIAGRQVAKFALEELIALRDKLKETVRMQRSDGMFVRNVLVSFPPVGTET